jgi:23S rRNA pseudouridine2605 synthase
VRQIGDRMSTPVRLQKFIADCGITSRRKAETLIIQGRVKVNDRLITEMGVKVKPDEDAVFVDGQAIDNKVDKLYIVLHKPRGYMTTLSDPEGRKTVMDLVKEFSERIYPVGRLDYLS